MSRDVRYRAADVLLTYCGGECSMHVSWDAGVKPTRIVRAARRIVAYGQDLIALRDCGDRVVVLWAHEPVTYHLRAALREALKSRDGTYPAMEHVKRTYDSGEKPSGKQYFADWETLPLSDGFQF